MTVHGACAGRGEFGGHKHAQIELLVALLAADSEAPDCSPASRSRSSNPPSASAQDTAMQTHLGARLLYCTCFKGSIHSKLDMTLRARRREENSVGHGGGRVRGLAFDFGARQAKVGLVVVVISSRMMTRSAKARLHGILIWRQPDHHRPLRNLAADPDRYSEFTPLTYIHAHHHSRGIFDNLPEARFSTVVGSDRKLAHCDSQLPQDCVE
jgi:hypothetical protein